MLHRHAIENRDLVQRDDRVAVWNLWRAIDRENSAVQQPGRGSLGGVQLMTLGVIGEYSYHIFKEMNDRPLYLGERFRPGRVRVEASE